MGKGLQPRSGSDTRSVAERKKCECIFITQKPGFCGRKAQPDWSKNAPIKIGIKKISR